jgi:hypothetical protein
MMQGDWEAFILEGQERSKLDLSRERLGRATAFLGDFFGLAKFGIILGDLEVPHPKSLHPELTSQHPVETEMPFAKSSWTPGSRKYAAMRIYLRRRIGQGETLATII